MDLSVPKFDWNINCDGIKKLTKDLINDCTNLCNEIAQTVDLSYDNIIKPFNEIDIIFSNGNNFLQILGQVSPVKEIRDECTNSMAELSKFGIEMGMRKDLYDILKKFSESNLEKLDKESKRYVERLLIEGKQNGLHLDEETRNKIKALKQKISDLEIEFNKNVNEENTKIPFKKEDLDGLSEDMLNSLEKNENDEYFVTLKYPVYFPLMKDCKVPETRRKVLIAFDSRCINENTKLFEEIIKLRHELSNILGYNNYSEYALELCMAKNPQNVENFLNRLTVNLRPLLEKEYQILLGYKKDECEKLNIPFDGKINQSDIRYYNNIRERIEFNVDHNKLQEYFPFNIVIDGIFNIYQTLLGLEFGLIEGEVHYHEDVKLYYVKDKESQEIIGFFYTDMHPREGKFGHAAIFPMINGCLKSDGTRKLPVCNMVCNFTKATNDKPSLLTHDEVETFFHEFGHVMHHICSKVNLSRLSGTNVETDFLEAPSQMLENWVWEKESLKLMSKHYKDGTPIDEKLLDDLIKSRSENAGHFNLRQILFATIDQNFHKNDKANSREVYQKHMKDLLKFDIEDENMNMVASFSHLTGGYESKYYSYLWSEVFSHDMFATRFKKEGILNPKTGMDYRRCILQSGGTIDANEMLVNFLGREPNEHAFLKNKGIDLS